MRTLLVIRAGEHDPASRSVPRPGASTCCRKGRRRVRGPANAFHVLKPRKADSGPAAPEVRRGRAEGPGAGAVLPPGVHREPRPALPPAGVGGSRRGWGARAGWGRQVPTPITRPPAGPRRQVSAGARVTPESLACGVAAPEGARRGLSNLFLEGGPPRTGDTAKSPGTPRPRAPLPPGQADAPRTPLLRPRGPPPAPAPLDPSATCCRDRAPPAPGAACCPDRPRQGEGEAPGGPDRPDPDAAGPRRLQAGRPHRASVHVATKQGNEIQDSSTVPGSHDTPYDVF